MSGTEKRDSEKESRNKIKCQYSQRMFKNYDITMLSFVSCTVRAELSYDNHAHAI